MKIFSIVVLTNFLLITVETCIASEKTLENQTNGYGILRGENDQRDLSSNLITNIYAIKSQTDHNKLKDNADTEPKFTSFPIPTKENITEDNDRTLIDKTILSQNLYKPIFQLHKTTSSMGEMINFNKSIQDEQKFPIHLNSETMDFIRNNLAKSAISFRQQTNESYFHPNIVNNRKKYGKVEILFPKISRTKDIGNKSNRSVNTFLEKKRTKNRSPSKELENKKQEQKNVRRRINYKLGKLQESNNKILRKLEEHKKLCCYILKNISAPRSMERVNESSKANTKKRLNKSIKTSFERHEPFIKTGQQPDLQTSKLSKKQKERQDVFKNLSSNEARLNYLFDNYSNDDLFLVHLLKTSKFIMYGEVPYNKSSVSKGQERLLTVWETVQYVISFFDSKTFSLLSSSEKDNTLFNRNNPFSTFWTMILFLEVLSKDEILYTEAENKVKKKIYTKDIDSSSLKGIVSKVSCEFDQNVGVLIQAMRQDIKESKNFSMLDENNSSANSKSCSRRLSEVKNLIRFSHVMCNNKVLASIPISVPLAEYTSLKTVKDLFMHKFLNPLCEYFKRNEDIRHVAELELSIKVPTEVLGYNKPESAGDL